MMKRQSKCTLQINQTAIGLLSLLLTTPWVVRRRSGEASLLWHELLLLTKEWVVACMCSPQAFQTLTGGVDKRAWCGVLRGDTQVTHVTEGVLAFSGGEQSVETGVVRVTRRLRGSALSRCRNSQRGLEIGDGVGVRIRDRVGELSGDALF